jgi:hypothetical protein
VQPKRWAVLSNTAAHLTAAAIPVRVFPREELHGMKRLMNVTNKMDQRG